MKKDKNIFFSGRSKVFIEPCSFLPVDQMLFGLVAVQDDEMRVFKIKRIDLLAESGRAVGREAETGPPSVVGFVVSRAVVIALRGIGLRQEGTDDFFPVVVFFGTLAVAVARRNEIANGKNKSGIHRSDICHRFLEIAVRIAGGKSLRVAENGKGKTIFTAGLARDGSIC